MSPVLLGFVQPYPGFSLKQPWCVLRHSRSAKGRYPLSTWIGQSSRQPMSRRVFFARHRLNRRVGAMRWSAGSRLGMSASVLKRNRRFHGRHCAPHECPAYRGGCILNHCSADLRSAVSPTCSRLALGFSTRARNSPNSGRSKTCYTADRMSRATGRLPVCVLVVIPRCAASRRFSAFAVLSSMQLE